MFNAKESERKAAKKEQEKAIKALMNEVLGSEKEELIKKIADLYKLLNSGGVEMEKSIQATEDLNRKNIERQERLEERQERLKKDVAFIKAKLLRLSPRKQKLKLVKS